MIIKMDLSSETTLNKFTQLANNLHSGNELNLEAFASSFPKEDLPNLEKIKIVIDSINFPDELILSNRVISRLFRLITHYTCEIFTICNCNYSPFAESSLTQAGLVKGIDYIEIKFKVNSLKYYNALNMDNHFVGHEFFKEMTREDSETFLSFNGLKKLVNYMHSQALTKVEHYLYDSDGKQKIYTFDKILDFELVYKKTKELHAKNLKSYLDELNKAKQGVNTEPIDNHYMFYF